MTTNRPPQKTVTNDTYLYIRPIIPTCCQVDGNGVNWKILHRQVGCCNQL